MGLEQPMDVSIGRSLLRAVIFFCAFFGLVLVGSSVVDNMTSEIPMSYHDITVLDKNTEERSLLSDTYNVIFSTEGGEIIKLNNMTVYYSVEKGHTYNASFTYGFQGIVGEVN